MRILDRLRRRARDKAVERKLFETIAAGLVKEMAEEDPSSVSKPGKKITPTFKRIYHIRDGKTDEEAGEGVGFERARRSHPMQACSANQQQNSEEQAP